jgi:hypothetical protein
MSQNQARTRRGADGTSPGNGSEPQAAKNRPVHEERIGHIKAAIWANEGGQGGIFYSVTFTRIYRDGQGNWQTSDSFGRDDLLVLAKVADRAHTWICDTLQNQGSGG